MGAEKRFNTEFHTRVFQSAYCQEGGRMEHPRLKPSERRGHKWESVTKMDVEGRGCEDVN